MSAELNLANDLEQIRATCAICARPMFVSVPRDPEARKLMQPLLKLAAHSECTEYRKRRDAARLEGERQTELVENWRRICPDEFKKALDWKLCTPFRTQHDQIMGWNFGDRGLIAYGRTGRCKSRFVFKLLEREYFAGRRVAFFRHSDFRETVSRLSYESAAGLFKYIQPFRLADILLIDDLGKARITEASEEAIEGLIDERTRNGRPILITTNEGEESLGARLSQDRGEPMLRRILDFCAPVDFGFT
jgi:hypothetical protein